MAMWDHCLKHAAISDMGLRRANNQDAMTVVIAGSQEMFRRRGHLFMVADGMGAHAAGELASKLAADTVALSYPKMLDRPLPDALATAITEANAQIHGRGQASPDFRGMGTTSTVMLLLPQGVVLGHVGDSRAYRLRGGKFEQLTFDHSLVWELRAAGQLGDSEAESKVPKNVITRSLGPNANVQVDLEGPLPVQTGDVYLLCSDGLSGPVADHEMGMILASMPPDDAVRVLVDLANLRGGPDNITVIVVAVTGPLVAQGAETSDAKQQPPRKARPVHPALWAAIGLGVLTCVAMAALGQWPVAVAGLAVAAIAGVVALAQRYGGDDDAGLDGRVFGRGPYTSCSAVPTVEFIDELSDTLARLRKLAVDEDWRFDWSELNELVAQADKAKTEGDLATAVNRNATAIRLMMSELKKQRRDPSDSNIFG